MQGSNQDNPDIDLALSVVCAIAKPGEVLGVKDLAEICGCAVGTISTCSSRAIRKLRDDPRYNQVARDYGY